MVSVLYFFFAGIVLKCYQFVCDMYLCSVVISTCMAIANMDGSFINCIIYVNVFQWQKGKNILFNMIANQLYG